MCNMEIICDVLWLWFPNFIKHQGHLEGVPDFWGSVQASPSGTGTLNFVSDKFLSDTAEAGPGPKL